MAEAWISPAMLAWARKRVGLNAENLAEKLRVQAELCKRWESGESHPTFLQAQKLAKQLHIPFGFLYLKEPPEHFERGPKVPDMRTRDNRANDDYSVELQEVLWDVLSNDCPAFDLTNMHSYYHDASHQSSSAGAMRLVPLLQEHFAARIAARSL